MTQTNTERTEERKNRFSGETGAACNLHYNLETGCLSEVIHNDF